MPEHPSQQQMGLYQSRALAPERFLSIHRHLESCPDCYAQLSIEGRFKEDYEVLLAAVMPDSSEPAYHLTSTEISDFVGDKLDQISKESAESHLEVCAECMQTAEALRGAAVGYPITSEKVEESWGVGAFLAAQARPVMFGALILVIIAVLLTLFLARKRESQQPGGDQKTQVNTPTPTATRELTVEQDQKNSNQPHDSPTQPNPDSTSSVSSLNDNSSRGPQPIEPSVISTSLQRAITLAAQTGRLERPQILAELRGTNGNLLSDSGNRQPFQLLSPIGQVLNDRFPTFRWQPLGGASSYQVTIVDQKLDEVATSGQITNPEWRVSQPLKPGSIYSWQVTAFKDGNRITSPVMPAPQAKFKILDQRQSEQLRRLKQAPRENHLALGVFYAQAGLVDDAEREFQELLKDKDQAALAEKLLNSVRSMRK